jgi:predicted protein tyrosine phosphatase
MIVSLLITDLCSAENYAYSHSTKYNLWISVNDPEDAERLQQMQRKLADKKTKHHYQLFYDWCEEDRDPYIQKNLHQLGPQPHQIEALIKILQESHSDPNPYHLGINCFAGVSRSSAVGLIALVITGKSPQEALTEICRLRPQAWPNLRVLRLASPLLKQNIAEPVASWKKREGLYLPT